MSPYVLREVTASDLEPMLDFLSEIFDDPDVAPSVRGTFEDHDGYCEVFHLHRVRRFVVLDRDVIATTGYYAENSKTAWLSWFAVREDLRGRQIGTRLLRWTMRLARQDGFEAMHIETGWDNHGARRFYGRNGFVLYGITSGHTTTALLRQPLIAHPDEIGRKL